MRWPAWWPTSARRLPAPRPARRFGWTAVWCAQSFEPRRGCTPCSNVDLAILRYPLSASAAWACRTSMPDETRRRLSRPSSALDLGVTFLDTADMYGVGQNEELVGRAIRDR